MQDTIKHKKRLVQISIRTGSINIRSCSIRI